MKHVTNLWSLDQNKELRFQKKSLTNFPIIAGDPDPMGLGGWVRAFTTATQPFSLSLRIQLTFWFPIQKFTTIDSLNSSLYH
jgi:hypothetical protein